MEVTSALRRYLLAQDAIRGQVQDRIWKDRLEEKVQGTGGKAIVVSEQPFGFVQDSRKTDEWPVAWIDCYADATRDGSGNIIKTDAIDKAKALMRVVVPYVHGKRGERWGAFGSNPGLMVISAAQTGRRYWNGGDDAVGHVNSVIDEDVMVARIILLMNVAHETRTV